MQRITRSALVPFSAEQMFNLVTDVESYPQFLPGCVGSRVIAFDGNVMTASLDVAKAGISKTFVTRNELVANSMITLQLVEGPFQSLSGHWVFTPLDINACKVELNLEFEFTNSLVELAFGRIFNELAASMVSVFTKRAREMYAKQRI